MSIPGMSSADYANVCKFSFRQAMSSTFSDSLRFAPISTQRSGKASSKHTEIMGSCGEANLRDSSISLDVIDSARVRELETHMVR